MDGLIHISMTSDYKVCDPCPDGYIARQEWADVHLRAGLKQKPCSNCGKFKFPHELSTNKQSYKAKNKKGEEITVDCFLCLECELKGGAK